MNILNYYKQRRARDQAARWHTGINRGLTDAERRKFETWISEPANEREFRACRTLVDVAMEIKGLPRKELEGLIAETEAKPKPARSRSPALRQWLATSPLWASGVATAAVLTVAGGWVLLRSAGYVPRMYETATGEMRTVVLPDGSTVGLNTQTVLEWVGGVHDRRVRLIRGEAYFQVVHDPSRPFRIILAHSQVQVLGTSFDVYQKTDGDVRVSVITGTVAVEALDNGQDAPSWSRRLTAGQQIEYSPFGLVADVHSVLAPKVIRWRQGMLETQGEPLKDFISDISRYTTERIVIVDPRAAVERVGGAFSIRNVDGTLNRLSRIAPVTVKREKGEVILGYGPVPTGPPPDDGAR